MYVYTYIHTHMHIYTYTYIQGLSGVGVIVSTIPPEGHEAIPESLLAGAYVCVVLTHIYFLLLITITKTLTITKILICIYTLDSDFFYLSSTEAIIFIFYLQINLKSILVFHQSTSEEKRTHSAAPYNCPSTISKKIHYFSTHFPKNFIHFVPIAHIISGYHHFILFPTTNIQHCLE